MIKINKKKSSDRYYNLDIARYLSSVLIIIVHLGPFVKTSAFATFLLNNTLVRLCVPLFLMITGYFVIQKEEKEPNYVYRYIKSMLPMYIFWSLIYLPFGLSYIKDLALNPFLYPLTLVVAFVYLGSFYHLWYFPALIVALLLIKFLRKYISIPKIMLISFVLLLLGSFETYYGILPGFIQNIMDGYFKYFFTTRNFLFFALFYLSLGHYLGLKENAEIKHSFRKTILFLFVFILEIYIIHGIKRMDCNILISAVPLSYYAFLTFLNTKKLPFIEFKFPLRSLSTYYYLIHPLVFSLLNFLIPKLFSFKKIPYSIAFTQIVIALIVTHLISNLILELKAKYKKLPI